MSRLPPPSHASRSIPCNTDPSRVGSTALAAVLAAAVALLGPTARAQCPSPSPTLLRASDDPTGAAALASVAIEGEWAVATRNGASGVPAAAIFLRRVSGTWMEHQIVLPVGPVALEKFGTGRAVIRGDLAVVGSPAIIPGTTGSAYVFRRVGTVWAQEAQIPAFDGDPTQQYGACVDTDGTRLIVGLGIQLNDLGAAYIYVHTPSGWVPEQKLTQPGTPDINGFGSAVQIEGTTAFVSEPINPVLWPAPGYGKVHIYQFDGVAWSLQSSLVSPAPSLRDSFGESLAFDGTTLAISRDLTTTMPMVFLYRQTGGVWSLVGTAGNSNTFVDVTPGALAIDGSILAFGDSEVHLIDQSSGAIRVFEEPPSSTAWSPKAQLFDPESTSIFSYPRTLAMSGDTIIATSYQDADAELFSVSKPEIEKFETEVQKIVPATNPNGNFATQRIAADGDHLFLGIAQDATNGANSGAVYAYQRVGGVWTNEVKLLGIEVGGNYGSAVAVKGDLAMIGARKENAGKGRVHVLEWNGAAWNEVQVLNYPFTSAHEMGSSIAIDGTVAVIGADGPSNNAGRALVFEKQGASWVFKQLLNPTLPSPQAVGEAGADVAISGDTILIGAPWTWTPTYQAGAAFIYRKAGAATTWTLEATVLSPAAVETAHFASAVALDGDRALIGSSAMGPPVDWPAGEVYAFQRSGVTWSQTQVIHADQIAASGFGADIAMRGTDALVGASGGYACGALYQLRFVNGAWQRVQRFHNTASKTIDSFGIAVALTDTSIFGHERATLPIGSVNAYAIARLALYTYFNHPTAGEPLLLETTGGIPGAGGMLFITAVGGTPFLIPLVPGTFDTAGAFSLDVIVPVVSGLAGLALEFQSYTLSGSGAVIGSNKRTVTFD